MKQKVFKQKMLIGYRTNKLDTQIEGQKIMEKFFWESWVSKIKETITQIKKETGVKHPIIITVIAKL